MGGTIFLPDGRDWSVPGSVFAWVVDALTERAQDPGLAEHLRTIAEHDLGSLALADLTPRQRTEVADLLGQLPRIARAELPVTSARDVTVARLGELAELVDDQR